MTYESIIRGISHGLDDTPTYAKIFDSDFVQDYSRVYCTLMYMECRMKDVLSFCKARDNTLPDERTWDAPFKHYKELLDTYEEQTLGQFLPEFLRYFQVECSSDPVAYACLNRIHIWRNILSHTCRFIGEGTFQRTVNQRTQKKIDKFLQNGELWGDRLINSYNLMYVMRDVVILDTVVMPMLSDKHAFPYSSVEGVDELENMFPFWKEIIGWNGLQERVNFIMSMDKASSQAIVDSSTSADRSVLCGD